MNDILYIGVDNGGTKCSAEGFFLTSPEIRTKKTIPGGNPYDIGSEKVAENIIKLIESIRVDKMVSLISLCYGSTGGGTPHLIEEIDTKIQAFFSEKKIKIQIIGCTDWEIAMHDLLQSQKTKEAVLSIVGTGGITVYKKENEGGTPEIDRGNTGLGWVLSDPGSARSIGMQGARLFRKRLIQGKTDFPFFVDMKHIFGETDRAHIVEKTLVNPPEFFASIAPIILAHADGDSEIQAIVTQEVTDLTESISSILSKHPTCTTLGLTGGLVTHFPEYRKQIEQSLTQSFPHITLISGINPLRGALSMASKPRE